MPMTRRLWTISGLAVELDRDRRTIASALKSTPPDGRSHRHDAWFLTTALGALQPAPIADEELDPAQERARKDRALAIAAEIKNDIATGRVVPIDDVVGAVTAQYSRVRNKLIGLPSKVAPRAAALRSAEPVRALIEAEVIQALAELTTGAEGMITLGEAREAVRQHFVTEAA